MSEASLPREILHREGFYPEESTGLFVGISSFVDDSFAPVPFAVDDAVDLAWVFVLHLQLVDPKRTVLALAGEPRKQISRERLDALLQAGARRDNAGLTQLHRLVSAVGRSSGPRGLFVLTAATHGLSDQGGDYLVATDTLRDGLLDTALKLPTLLDRITQLPAKRRLVLLDACREQMNHQRSVAKADPAMATSFAAAIGRAVGQTVLMASVAGGYSYDDTTKENGVFSGALVDGLCGAAQADSEGLITVGAVAEYARERVQSFVREHRPKHVSRGIEERYEEKARDLPLAIDPARTRALDTHRARREAAVNQLHKNIGGGLDGRRIEDIKDFLPTAGLPSAQVEELLTEIEALDGSARSKRSLLFLLETLRASTASEKLLPLQQPQPEFESPPTFLEDQIAYSNKHSSSVPWYLIGLVAKRLLFWVVNVAIVAFLTSWLVRWPGFGGFQEPESTEKAVVEPAVAAPKQPEAVMTDTFGQLYRWVPGGTYTIGSPQSDSERWEWEEESHPVTLAGFWMAETEVTQEQWKRHGLRNPSRFDTCATCPVENVSWWEAAAFANLLSNKAKLEACYDLEGCTGELGTMEFVCSAGKVKGVGCTGYRLPTAEEWEVAAMGRIGSSAYEARYGQLEEIAWYKGNSGGRSHPVGWKQANAWGLEDMLGNVLEWTESADDDSIRIIRGGSWTYEARNVRAAFLFRYGLNIRDSHLGFRFLLGRPRSSQEK